MWRGGCIIRSVFLGKIKAAFAANPQLTNLLLDDFFAQQVASCQHGWRQVVSVGVQHGIPMPAFSTGTSHHCYSELKEGSGPKYISRPGRIQALPAQARPMLWKLLLIDKKYILIRTHPFCLPTKTGPAHPGSNSAATTTILLISMTHFSTCHQKHQSFSICFEAHFFCSNANLFLNTLDQNIKYRSCIKCT